MGSLSFPEIQSGHHPLSKDVTTSATLPAIDDLKRGVHVSGSTGITTTATPLLRSLHMGDRYSRIHSPHHEHPLPRYSLLPSTYTLFHKAHKANKTVMCALACEVPNDPQPAGIENYISSSTAPCHNPNTNPMSTLLSLLNTSLLSL